MIAHFADCVELFMRVYIAAKQTGSGAGDSKTQMAETLAFRANTECLYGSTENGRTDAAKSLALAGSQPDEDVVGALAICRDTRSKAAIVALAKASPRDWLLKDVNLPIVHAILAMHSNDPQQALELLQPVEPYRLAQGADYLYFAGLANLQAKNAKDAAADFQAVLNHRGLYSFDPCYPLAKLGLAKALVLQGNAAAARTAYQDFFAFWKDADPNIPLLVQAKAEYARLH